MVRRNVFVKDSNLILSSPFLYLILSIIKTCTSQTYVVLTELVEVEYGASGILYIFFYLGGVVTDMLSTLPDDSIPQTVLLTKWLNSRYIPWCKLV